MFLSCMRQRFAGVSTIKRLSISLTHRKKEPLDLPLSRGKPREGTTVEIVPVGWLHP
jgi:hypothetical protein